MFEDGLLWTGCSAWRKLAKCPWREVKATEEEWYKLVSAGLELGVMWVVDGRRNESEEMSFIFQAALTGEVRTLLASLVSCTRRAESIRQVVAALVTPPALTQIAPVL